MSISKFQVGDWVILVDDSNDFGARKINSINYKLANKAKKYRRATQQEIEAAIEEEKSIREGMQGPDEDWANKELCGDFDGDGVEFKMGDWIVPLNCRDNSGAIEVTSITYKAANKPGAARRATQKEIYDALEPVRFRQEREMEEWAKESAGKEAEQLKRADNLLEQRARAIMAGDKKVIDYLKERVIESDDEIRRLKKELAAAKCGERPNMSGYADHRVVMRSHRLGSIFRIYRVFYTNAGVPVELSDPIKTNFFNVRELREETLKIVGAFDKPVLAGDEIEEIGG